LREQPVRRPGPPRPVW